jgi:hypothetical protein
LGFKHAATCLFLFLNDLAITPPWPWRSTLAGIGGGGSADRPWAMRIAATGFVVLFFFRLRHPSYLWISLRYYYFGYQCIVWVIALAAGMMGWLVKELNPKRIIWSRLPFLLNQALHRCGGYILLAVIYIRQKYP